MTFIAAGAVFPCGPFFSLRPLADDPLADDLDGARDRELLKRDVDIETRRFLSGAAGAVSLGQLLADVVSASAIMSKYLINY